MENITNAIPVVAADDAVDDDDAKWLSVPLEDVPIGKRRRLSSLSAERKDGKSSSPYGSYSYSCSYSCSCS